MSDEQRRKPSTETRINSSVGRAEQREPRHCVHETCKSDHGANEYQHDAAARELPNTAPKLLEPLCATGSASADQSLVFQNWLNGFVREDKSESVGRNGVRSKSTGRASGTLLQRLGRRLHRRSEPRRFTNAAPRLAAVERVEDRCLLAAFVVDTVIDESDGNLSAGDLSLREAIEAANAQAGPDTISFSPTVFGTAQTIDLVLGEFAITDELTITGPGRDLLTIDAQGNSRHFNIDDGDENSDMEVTISGVALTNGHATDGNDAVVSDEDRGGAVFAQDYLRLLSVRMHQNVAASIGGALILRGGGSISDSTFNDNSAGRGGGALYLDGTTQLLRSEVLQNRATGGLGGGVFNFGELAVQYSTVSENSASFGGGIWNRNGRLWVSDSIVVGNSASEGGGLGIERFSSGAISNTTIIQNQAGEGGGVFIEGERDTPVTISSTTIYGNRATGRFGQEFGGGISSRESLTPVTNSIIAGNVDLDGNPNDTEGTGARGSYNLIGDPGTAGWYEHGVNNNIVGQNDGSGGRETLDLLTVLGPLADNGGFTQTHALLPGSIAVDAGDPNFDPNTFDPPLTTDQRGGSFSRLANAQQTLTARIDIGAFELQPAAATVELSTNGQDFSIDENASQSVNLRLTTAPTSSVVVRFTTTDEQNLELSQSEFTFTPSNWNLFQTLTVRGVPRVQQTDDAVATISVDVVDNQSDDAFDAAGGSFDVTIVNVALAPAVTGPLGTIAEARPVITWNEIPEAVSYELWLERIGDDSGPVVNPTVADTSFVLTEDLTIARYRTWVRANFGDGSRSTWTSATFTYSQPLQFIGLEELNGQTRPRIVWQGLPGVSGYRVFLRNALTGELIVDRVQQSVQYRPETDLPFGRYHVWVRAVGPANYQAEWSAVGRHAVGPQLIGPAVSTFSLQPEFSWTTLPNIASYQLYVQTGRSVVINESGITSPTYTPSTPLPEGQYRWWVRPFDAEGNAGGWSLRGDFYVGGRTNITAPASPSTGFFTTIAWQDFTDAVSYDVYLYNETQQQIERVFTGITGNGLTPGALQDGDYRVWVRPRGADDQVGLWSRPLSFEVDAVVSDATATPVHSATVSMDSIPTLEWTGSQAADSFEIFVTNGHQYFFDDNRRSMSYSPPETLTGDEWRWRVRALDALNQPGPWSDWVNIDVTGRAVITGPNSAATGNEIIVAWTPVQGATHYVFQLDRVSANGNESPANAIVRDDFVEDPFRNLTMTLSPGRYRAWVRAVDGTNRTFAPWSFAWYFDVEGA